MLLKNKFKCSNSLFVDHLMVHGSLSFGILLFLDLLLEGCWKVLAHLSIPGTIAFVVVVDLLWLQAIRQSTVLAYQPFFADLRDKVREIIDKMMSGEEKRNALESSSVTRISINCTFFTFTEQSCMMMMIIIIIIPCGCSCKSERNYANEAWI